MGSRLFQGRSQCVQLANVSSASKSPNGGFPQGTKLSPILFAIMVDDLGPVSRKSRELFGPEKPFVIVRPAYSVKLVFSYVVKGIKTKITAKFRASRRLRFEDTKRIMSREIRPKSFGTFEKQAPGVLLGS